MITTARLRAIATDLSLLPEGASYHEPNLDLGMVTEVLRKHRVTATEFMLLDDTPGRLGYDIGNGRGWHWKLRRWRNSGYCSRYQFTPEQRCKTCGAYRTRNPETGRLCCPVQHERMGR